MVEEKIDQVLDEIKSLKEGQQKNYDLIQKNGIQLEKLSSDIKAVAEGHGVIRNEMKQMGENLTEKISFVDKKVDFLGTDVKAIKIEIKEIKTDLKEVKETVSRIDQRLEEHIQQPAHMMPV